MREADILQVVTNPLWVAKTRLQTQHMQLQWRRQQGALYSGAFNALLRMTREEGLLGLYRCQPLRWSPIPLVSFRAVAIVHAGLHHSTRDCIPSCTYASMKPTETARLLPLDPADCR